MSSELKMTFNDVAELYDEMRPGPPDQLVEDVITLSGISPRGRILEIACGPGKATLPFARRGYRMVCVELGANLARLAAQHCASYPDIEILNMAFEEWPLEPAAFDLVTCAEALHWIAPDVRFSKPAAALREGGAIAIFWHGHVGGPPAFSEAVDALFQRRAPQLLPARHEPAEELESETFAEIEGSGLFGPVTLRHYPWEIEYSAEQYVKLLSTYSSMQSLERELRESLLAEMRGLIGERGGCVKSEYVSRLYVAHKKSV